MRKAERADGIDVRILQELSKHPRATTVAVANEVGIARNTAQTRLTQLEHSGALGSFERRISPSFLGYTLTAFITAQVEQQRLDQVANALAAIPEVIEVHGLSGPADLLIHVVAADADDLYRIAGLVLAIPNVERSTTALVMRELIGYRLAPLMAKIAATETLTSPRQA